MKKLTKRLNEIRKLLKNPNISILEHSMLVTEMSDIQDQMDSYYDGI